MADDLPHELPGLERKIRVMLDWTLDLVFPRDIVFLRSMVHSEGTPAIDVESTRT